MIALAIDTCGASGSIALARVEPHSTTILAQTTLAGKTYSAQLVPALRALLAEQHLQASALDTIVVVNGPGSFTGVRIGAGTAKGLAQALNIPLLAVSRLAVLAARANTESAALDAGRNEFYFRTGEHETLLAARDASSITSTVAVCEATAQQAFSSTIPVEPPTAADALHVTAPRLLAKDFANVETLDGNYVRRSDAELFAKPLVKT